MRHLPKHLRPRWRYLVCALETPAEHEPAPRALQTAVWEAARGLLGDPGSADADLRVIRTALGPGGGTAVVRARRDEVATARAALACVHSVDGTPVGLRVLGVSGTLRAAEEKYMTGPAGTGEEDTVVFDGASRRAVHRGDGRVDLHGSGARLGATELDLE